MILLKEKDKKKLNSQIKEESQEESDIFFSDPNYVHFIGMLFPPRPGVQSCFVELEHKYFPPGTDLNNDFIMRMVKWQDMVWVIVSIPRSEMNLMSSVVEKNGLRLARGIPHIFSSKGKEHFPIKDSERVFTLENTSNHPAYTNDSNIIKELSKEEHSRIEEIFKETDDAKKMK